MQSNEEQEQDQTEVLKQQRETLLSEIQQLRDSLQEITAQNSIQQANYDSEIFAKQKLIDMHCKINQENEEEIKSLKEQVHDLNSKHLALNQNISSLEVEAQSKHAELLTQVETLKHDLSQHANSDASSETPVISETVQLLSKKQRDGKSFTEVYNDYVNIRQELILNQCSSRALHHSVNSLTHALETQIPLLKEQKTDYDFLVDEANIIATQLSQLLVTHRQTLKTLSDLENRESSNKDENERLKLEISNFSQSDSTGLDLSNKNLNLISLQEQNLKLRSNLQELKDHINATETQFLNQIKDLENSLEQEWIEKNQELESSRQTQITRIKALESEREMLLHLVQSKQNNQESGNSSLNTVISSKESDILLLKKELEEANSQHLANFKLLQQQHADLLLQRESQLTKIAYLEAQIQGLQERNNSFMKQGEHHNREVQELRRRNLDLESLLLKREMLHENIAQEAEELRSQYEISQISFSGLMAENKILKKNNTQLSSETESLMREKSLLSNSIINLQLHFETLHSREQEAQSQHEIEFKEIQEQCQTLQNSLNQSQSTISNLQQTYEKDLSEKQQKIDRLDNVVHEVQSKLLITEESLKQAQLLNESLREESAKARALFEDVASSGISSDELISTLNELQQVRDELSLRCQSELQYQAISKASEEALQALQESYQDYKSTSEKIILGKDQQIHELTIELEKLKTKISTLEENLAKQTSKSTQKIKELQKLKDLADKALNDANEKIVELNSQHSSDAAQMASLIIAADTARSNYESELTKHSAKVKECMKLKKEYLTLQDQIIELQDQLRKSQEDFKALEELSETQKFTFTSQINDLNQTVENLELQNREFIIQIKASDNPNNLASGLPSLSNKANLVVPSSSKSKMIEAKLEATEAANKRLELEKDLISKSLSKLRTSFDEYRSLSESQLCDLKQEISDITRKASILEESSSYNRKENEKLLQRISRFTTESQAAKKTILSLQEKIQVLEQDIASKEKALELSQEDIKSWKDKTQAVLDKSQAGNSEEMTKLNEERQMLQARVEELQLSHEKVTLDYKQLEERHAGAIKELEEKIRRLNLTGLSFKKRFEQLNAEKAKGVFNSEEREALNSLKELNISLNSQLSDIMNVKASLETRVTLLTENLQKAKEALKNQADVKPEVSELTALQEKIESLTSDLSAEKEKYSKILLQARRLKKAFEDQKVETSQAKENLVTVTGLLNEAKDELQKFKESGDQSSEDTQSLTDKILALENTHQQAISELSQAKDKDKDLAIEQLTVDNETKLKNFEMRHKLQISKHQRNIQKLTDEIEQLKKTLARLENPVETSQENANETNSTSNQLPSTENPLSENFKSPNDLEKIEDIQIVETIPDDSSSLALEKSNVITLDSEENLGFEKHDKPLRKRSLSPPQIISSSPKRLCAQDAPVAIPSSEFETPVLPSSLPLPELSEESPIVDLELELSPNSPPVDTQDLS